MARWTGGPGGRGWLWWTATGRQSQGQPGGVLGSGWEEAGGGCHNSPEVAVGGRSWVWLEAGPQGVPPGSLHLFSDAAAPSEDLVRKRDGKAVEGCPVCTSLTSCLPQTRALRQPCRGGAERLVLVGWLGCGGLWCYRQADVGVMADRASCRGMAMQMTQPGGAELGRADGRPALKPWATPRSVAGRRSRSHLQTGRGHLEGECANLGAERPRASLHWDHAGLPPS